MTYGGKRKKAVSPTDKRKSVNGSFQSPYSRVHRNPTERLRERKRANGGKEEPKKKGKGRKKKEAMKKEGREGERRKLTNETHLALVQLLFISWFVSLVPLQSATTRHL